MHKTGYGKTGYGSTRSSGGSKYLAASAIALALGSSASPAEACGGFFCSQAQPVNQAAERIVFSQNGDGTVTAVIQILYEGPSENFSWLLPISTVPDGDDIAVASDLAFTRLQAATNPAYNLNTRTEGRCRDDGNFVTPGSASPVAMGATSGSADLDNGSGVTVAASGVVGAFEWTALELDPMLSDPAASAIDWLTDNGYDVTPGADGLLRPYLAEGMYLLALRLTKGSSTGSIRPIVLTYDAELPMIPIKLTAVAANDDMGVMTWLLSDARAVPMNYNALELNEARINWFNAASNYDQVVTSAADDAGGQGFVTEFAGASAQLGDVVWSASEEQAWQQLRTAQYSSFDELFFTLYGNYGSFDGFWDAVRATVTFSEETSSEETSSENVSFEDFQLCPTCYSERVKFSPSALLQAMDESAIEPMRIVQELLERRPYITRLYSTLSAADMTVDPLFTMNADLPELSNVHTADRIIECNPNVSQFDAPWRIELPQGSVIRGTAQDVGSWPSAVDTQPANLRVLMLSESGPGAEVENNKALIDEQLATYNMQVSSGIPMRDREGSSFPYYTNDSGSGGGCALSAPGGTSKVSRLGAAGLLFGLVALRRLKRLSGARLASK